jgi:hypothetical protein
MLGLRKPLLPPWRWWPLVSLVALVLVAVIGLSSSRHPQKPQDHTTANNKKYYSAIDDDSTANFAIGAWASVNHDAIEALAAIVSAFFAIVLTGSTIGLWIVTRTAANAAKISADIAKRTLTELERPYIFVDIPKFIPSPIEGRPHNVQYILKNYGRTPAIVRWLKASALAESQKNPVWGEIFNGQIVFKSGDEKEIQPNVRSPLPYPNTTAIGEPPVLLVIEITYSDVFDYIHVNDFTFFESGGSFHAIAGKKYNRSKSEKLPEGVEWTPAWSEKPR